ncbi:carboxypeptidase-like regulatory domain-containing protein [Pelotomaculum terephthalicicum JT]|uniref:carboxypeptidase-like regulatory domain-containing protein n=1 Tax=Pelotomaculum terephthalicicum TaxID=206393 RepID=UPI001F041D5F|nr:carboxypeptidase-like regulatory domain-containing protein [Pelotomaculum terephthalicicum]MCG9968455.1 carboxypeptidase-like regulatory domain-containing protein [Pelotomaculum terephthalicicum JT]
MEYRRKVKFSTKVSLVVCPVDDYTASPKSGGNIHVFLREHPGRPVRKADGYFVFTGLPVGTYHVVVQSDIYLNETTIVKLEEIDPAEPIVYISLKPNSAYPFPAGTTLLRAALRDSGGNPAPDANVRATVMSASCAGAKVAQGGVKKGLHEINLTNVAGKIAVGDIFLIKEQEEVCSEYCVITGVSKGTHSYQVAEPLRYDHKRGVLLLPVVVTRADQRGEVVAYFRGAKEKIFDVKVEFSCENKIKIEELKMTEGEVNYLGIVQI